MEQYSALDFDNQERVIAMQKSTANIGTTTTQTLLVAENLQQSNEQSLEMMIELKRQMQRMV